MSSDKTSNSLMELYCEEDGLFYLGAQTVWLPAEHFLNIDNWDDSLKPSAAHYIKQVEEWIASKEECAQENEKKENESRNVANEEQENDATISSVIITKPTPNNNVEESCQSQPHLVGRAKSFACNQCGKKFSLRRGLTLHLRVHSGEKSFSCSQCGKPFAQRSNLTRHVQRIHFEEKPFACSQCGKAFAYKHDLTRHYRIHSQEKHFACSQCGKAFARKSTLTAHFRIHTGEKPFACSQCGKAYSDRSHLTYHIRTAHSAEKPYKRCKVFAQRC